MATAIPASIRNNNPGAQYPGASSRKFGALRTNTIGGGHLIAQFPDKVSGAAALFDLLLRLYVGLSLKDALTKWSGGKPINASQHFRVFATPTSVVDARCQSISFLNGKP